MAFCIGFTGTEFDGGMNEYQLGEVRALLTEELDRYSAGEVIARHGDCIGADAQFHALCLELEIPIVIHPPTEARMRAYCEGALRVEPERKYLDRNDDIARLCNCLLATPREKSEIIRSGVWATVRYARQYHKPVAIVYRNGDTVLEVEDEH